MQKLINSIVGNCLIRPSANALLCSDSLVTYGMLADGISSVVAMLSAKEIDLSKPVGVLIENPVRFVIINLALSKLGACVAAFNQSTATLANSLDLACLISDKEIRGTLKPVHVVDADWFSYPQSAGKTKSRQFKLDDFSRIEFTSGSTGRPKAVAFTESSLYSQTINRIVSYSLSSLRTASLFSVTSNVGFGFVVASLVQGKMVALPETNDAAIDMIHGYSIQTLACSPAQIVSLMNRLRSQQISAPKMDKIILAGAAVSGRELADVRLFFGSEIHIDYGSTETGPLAYASGDMIDYTAFGTTALWPHQDIRIDVTSNKDGDNIGPIKARSTGMGHAYVGLSNHSKVESDDMWFYTGDEGYFDKGGLLHLVGRREDILNLGGVKLSIEMIESYLREMTAVNDAAVISVSNLNSVGQLAVFLVSENAIELSFLNDVVKKRFKDLNVTSIQNLKEIPKTTSGKVDRIKLKSLVVGLR